MNVDKLRSFLIELDLTKEYRDHLLGFGVDGYTIDHAIDDVDKLMEKFDNELKSYHVTYYYLATGMEGVADVRDYGVVTAKSEAEALEIIAQRTLGEEYKDNLTYRYWGLSAEELK